jgi:plastocyanin
MGMVGLLALGLGCGSDRAGTNPVAPDRQYWQLSLNHHAVTLAKTAPSNTLQLTATPLTADGTVVPNTDAVATFTVSNPAVVSVSPTGLLTAVGTGSSVTVIARLTIGGLTLADTAIVNVNDVATPPVLTTLSIQPATSDSAKVAVGFSANIGATVQDQDSNSLTNVAVHYWSSDPTIATVSQTGTVSGKQRGKVTLYAEATAYGVTKTDSLPYVIGAPFIATEVVSARTPRGSLTPESYFSPDTLTVGVGAYVLWINTSGQPVDVVFDDPSAAHAVDGIYLFAFASVYGLTGPYNPNEAGNISEFAPVDSTRGNNGQGVRIRWFTQEGTYSYHSTLYNTSGAIVVTRD